ncbi:MAG TPA: uroporphyrinogen-III C-methyltransferase [Gammaproteobacteria bacterium]|nr:uroporphyrinogen-III C-methyltransferase [Gammaproteobacteria bacterium]
MTDTLSKDSAAAPRGVQRAVLSSSVALLFAFVAIVIAGMLWWQYRQFYVSLDETDTAAAAALERVRAEQRALQDGLADANDDVGTLRQLNTSLGERLDALPGRFAALEERLDAVQGGSFDARGNLLRSEAEYYLTVANTELTLTADYESAVTALELADSRLAEIANPELAPVREAIAGELLGLRSLRLPDIEGTVFGLGRLAARADELPLRADLPVNLASQSSDEREAEPGFGRLWIAIKGTLLDLVRIERRDDPVPQALSAAERALARRQLEVELELARIAALRRDEQAFLSGLETAIAVLQRDFDSESADVEGALALLGELRSFDIDPEPPDISGSLNLLRAQRNEPR